VLQYIPPRGVGWIEVICGCMFSGKTEELIRRLRRARFARQRVIIFKPAIDDRYDTESIVTHDALSMEARQVTSAAQIPELVGDHEVVGVDEAQFFGDGLVAVLEELANRGLRVVVAGLDQDYLGRPFEPIPQLMAVAEYVTKTLAICMVCGNPADRSQRIVARDGQVLVGATDAYEARCRRCFNPDAGAPVQQRIPGTGGDERAKG
jgi:thymidine kinase